METENPIQIGEFQKREPQPSTSRNYGLRSNTVSTTVKELQKREDDYVTIETLNYRDVWEACTEALKMKKLVGITGYPGAGKTTTLEKFRSKYSSAVTGHWPPNFIGII